MAEEKRVREFGWYVEQAKALIERDSGLRKFQAAMDRMSHLEYKLPDRLQKLEWLRTIRTSAPYDALRGATRALSNLDEILRLQPISVLKGMGDGFTDTSPQARARANEWEVALKWQMDRAMARSPVGRSDVIYSAVLYDEICAQLVHLPTQIKAIEELTGTGSAKRQRAALRHGSFAVLLRNPQTVHTRYSDYMLEGVLYVAVHKPQEIVDFWGAKAAKIAAAIDSGDAPDSYVVFNFSDYSGGRCVWAVEGDDEASASEQDDPDRVVKIVEPAPLTHDFLPWVCAVGGTALDADPQHRRRPLLYPVYRAEQWLNANIVGSLMGSQAIAEMGRPGLAVIGPGAENIEVDHGEPAGRIDAPPGTQIQEMAQKGLDPGLREMFDRLETAIDRATVSKVLVTAEPSPGETFSGYNLRVQTAIGSLLPYKALGEKWYEMAYTHMLYWTNATGEPLYGYGSAKDAKRRKGEMGAKYSIDSEDIDPESIYLSVELTPDVAIDRLQRIQGAIQMSQHLKIPVRMVLEELGVPDPDAALDEWMREQFALSELQGRLQFIQMQASGEIQQLAAQMAQQMLADAQAQAVSTATETLPFGEPTATSGTGALPPSGVEGALSNPAMGGLPAAMMNPSLTREEQTGRTRLGQEVAAV